MRLDLLTSDWHKLVKPVLPHASTDKELPHLRRVRLEFGARALYAVATDRYTLAAERWPLPPADLRMVPWQWPPVDIEAAEIAPTLKLFTYDKDADPPLHVTVDRAPIPLEGTGGSIDSWAVIIERPGDGLRLLLRDRRQPDLGIGDWRKSILAAMTRPRGRALDGLDVPGRLFARWASAVRGAEQLRVWTGPSAGDPLLITVEDHFAGIMIARWQLDDPARDRSALPWAGELLPEGVTADGEAGDD